MNANFIFPVVLLLTFPTLAQSSAPGSRIPPRDIPKVYATITLLQSKKYPQNPNTGLAKAEHVKMAGSSVTEKWTVFDSSHSPYFYLVTWTDRQGGRDIKVVYFTEDKNTQPAP